jgi:DNA-binding MarR family transcriptional regulator
MPERIREHWHGAVPNDRMAHLVKAATRGFLRALQTRLAEHDVPLGHWAFLRILWQRDGLTQRELSVAAGVMEPTTVAALRAMESKGLVTRAHRADNRKNMYVLLTREGKRLKKVLVPLAEEVNTVALRGLSEAQVATTRRSLLAMIENLGRDEGAPSEAGPA